MKKYDIIFEALQDKVENGELTLEEANILNDIAYEKYSDDMDEYVSEDYDERIEEAAEYVSEGLLTVEEACEYFEITEKTGNNAVLKKTIKKNRDKIYTSISDIKGDIKSKEYDKAERKINDLVDTLRSLKTEVNSIETDTEDDIVSEANQAAIKVASAIAAMIASIGMDCKENLDKNSKILDKDEIKQATMLAGLSAAGGVTVRTASFIKKGFDGKERNSYKIEALKNISDAIKQCDHLKKQIKRKKKFDKFIENGGKKKIALGTAAAAATGAATAIVAKKKLSEKK